MKSRIYKLNIITVSLLFLAGSYAIAQVKKGEANVDKFKTLSMNEAIELSLKNNKQLKLSTAKVEEAVANRHEMWNNHLPDAKVSGSYLRLNSPDVTLKIQTGKSTTGSGASTGTPKVEQAAYGILNASLPVFSGLRIKYGVESAKFLEMAAKLDADNDKEEVIQNTINAYSNLYKSVKTIDLIRENRKQQVQRVAEFTDLEKNGIIARNDLLKAQLQQSNIELSLLDAENNYSITCINMSLMLGLPSESILIPDSVAFMKHNESRNIEQWEIDALKNRKDMEALSYREKAAGSAIKSTKGEYYPGLAVTGGLIAADIPNLLTIKDAMNIGIGLQYNIGSIWKTGAKLDAAKARLHQVQANEGMLNDQVHLQVNQAYQNYLLSMKKIDVYAMAVEQANENYRITKNKYDNSLVTTTDLLDADVAQLQAKLNYAFSKADATVAFRKLEQVSGVLLTDFQATR